MQTARRMGALSPSVFTSLIEEKKIYEQKTGQPVIDFSLGSPNIPPAKAVIESLSQAALDPKNYKYAVSALPSLIDAIQKWYGSRYGVNLDKDEICILQGSQEALINFPLLYCNPGDGVLIGDPYYPAYEEAPHLADAKVLLVPLKKENDYLMDLDAISKEDRECAKLMIVCYPNNPTGAVAPDWFVEKLIKFAKENDILVLYDSAYSDLVFNGQTGRSFLSYPGAKEVGVELNSFSKSYGMAGARLGVLCGNKTVISQYKALKSNLDYGIFLPVQEAGITALETGADIVQHTRDEYIRRRELIQSSFVKAGWDLSLPEATMFVWAAIPEGYEDDEQFALDLLKTSGILVTPGSSFGKEGKGYVRLALVVDEEQISEAARRLEASHFFK